MNNDWLIRSRMLLGDNALEKLAAARVLLAGLGGVGSWTAEHLARNGVGQITLIDSDLVEPSNINRQLPATAATVGMAKTTVMAQRLRDINPSISLEILDSYITPDNAAHILDCGYSVAVDAIDTLAPKCAFLAAALQSGLPVVSSMGSGARLDPTQVRHADISKVAGCPLAREVRARLRKMNITSGIKAVYSAEPPIRDAIVACEGRNKKSTLGSVSFVTATFGATLAWLAINQLINKP